MANQNTKIEQKGIYNCKVEHRKLKSGLNVYLVHKDIPVTHFQLFVPFGGELLQYKDPETKKVMNLEPGSAHYFEHVLFIMPPLDKKGKPIMDELNPDTAQNLRDGLTELTKNNAIVVNAYTWNDITNYWFVTRKNPMENLKIMVEYVFTPYLPKDRFKEETGTILDEEKMYDNNPDAKQSKEWAKQAFVKHGAKFPVIGTQQTIPQIRLKDVLSMHSTFYRPSNMNLVIVGKADIKDVEKTVQEKLDSLGKGNFIPPPEEVIQEEPSSVEIKDNFDNPMKRKDIKRSNVLAGWKYLVDPTKLSNEDIIDIHLCVMIVRCALFGAGSKNREDLVKNGVDDRTLVAYSENFRTEGMIHVKADTEDHNKFRNFLLESMDNALKNGITEEEIEYAKNSLLTKQDTDNEDVIEFCDGFARWGVVTGDPIAFFRARERLENISAKEVNQIIKKVIKQEGFTCVLMVAD